uniref:Titin n=1 Tax=Parascaris univalens TaxID=6257 RepID=A0A914ZQA8_PARUN
RGGIQITSTSTTSELSILRLSEVHIGEYLCAVRNAYGEDLARARILLEAKLIVDGTPMLTVHNAILDNIRW